MVKTKAALDIAEKRVTIQTPPVNREPTEYVEGIRKKQKKKKQKPHTPYRGMLKTRPPSKKKKANTRLKSLRYEFQHLKCPVYSTGRDNHLCQAKQATKYINHHLKLPAPFFSL